MSTRKHLLRGAVALLSLGFLAGCGPQDNKVLGPSTPTPGAIFASYVSLGNSITAGWQSNGINDSTQKRAYPVLLAQSMGTSFIYPSLNMPGCPPPIANFQTGALVGPTVPNNCAFRNTGLTAVGDRVNNVAVPGAAVVDPTLPTTNCCAALTTFILGGMTQVQRALQAHPTFATIWIGNNDVLAPALSGILTPSPFSAGVTPVSTFTTQYDAMLNQLTTGAPGLKGVLIGVVQVGGIPAFSPGYVIAGDPRASLAIDAASGTHVTILPNCVGSTSIVDLVRMIPAIRAGSYPPYISCVKGQFPPSALVGDLFVLDDAEQASLQQTIGAYNAYIQGKANSLGWAYYDPNADLAALKAQGAIPLFPNFASATQPFGQYLSLDGIHPSNAAHVLFTNQLITIINSKFGTKLTPVQ